MIKLENLNYSIGDIEILKNINFEIERNEIVVLVGANGSGKSTLIKSIASLVNYRGKILIFGGSLRELKSKNRSRVVSYLPQNCLKTNIKVRTLVRHSRFPYASFGEKLSKNDNEIINNAISLTGIKHILHKNVMDISGGERQLAYLTMVIAQDTPVILLDEPNTFLDIEHQIFLFELIKKLKSNGKTVILVLHDLIQALEVADKIVVVNKGEVVAFGKPLDVKPEIEKIFNVKIAEINKISEYQNPLFKYCLVKEGLSDDSI